MPSWAWVVTSIYGFCRVGGTVSMPSRAWVVTWQSLSNYKILEVSMPSRAWVVTARMSNILNFLWYFLCIPAIYKCILAYLSIFFNQLSEFLRCESPSTFLGTCLSHHSFIIFLVTNTNTLLSGLYLISTVLLQKPRFYAVSRACFWMRCTYPWHWLKYSTNYNRCHPIFSLSW